MYSVYRQAALAIRRQYSKSEIISNQNKKLRTLIHYCYNNIKYYRELFETYNIKPENINSAEDLKNIPFLTKEQLRNRFWDFLPRRLPPCRVSRTSGSSGVPVCLLSDNSSKIFNSAAVIRYRKPLGIHPLYGPILTPLKNESEPDKKPQWTFIQGIHKTYYINPYKQSTENIEYAEKLSAKLRHPAIIGITPAIKTLAYKINDGIFPPFKPSVVLTSGESLEPQHRQLIENTFRCKVADIYACNEAGDIAWQCEMCNAYHINTENVIVEIINQRKTQKPEQVGEVVITNLNRYAMPIIRYKNGDLAAMSNQRCSCTRELPLLKNIAGRTGEDIIAPDGRKLPWNQMKSLMNHPRIRQFQIVQQKDAGLLVKFVSEKNTATTKLESLLLSRYRRLLGNNMTIRFEKVEKIPPAPSGKTKLVISHYKK